MLHTSQRSLVPTAPNALAQALDAKRARGVRVVDLTRTNPTELGLSLDAERLADALASADASRYQPEPFGELAARTAVAEYLSARGPEVDARDVMLSASTSEAYAFLFKLLCDPGDDVLVPAPSYPLLDMLAQLEGVTLRPYPLRFDGAWHLDGQALSALPGPRTRALIAVHPNNPTGSLVTRSELETMAALGLPIISDEVFAGYRTAPAAESVDTLAEFGERGLVFRLGGSSKELLLPQLKLAWTVLSGDQCSREIARARLEHIADAYLSVGTLVQRALPRLLAESEPLRARARGRIVQNRAMLGERLAGSAANLLPSEGGALAIVRLPALLDDEAFCLALLARHDTLVQPGYFYDLHGMCACVLSMLTPPGELREGARTLRNFIDQLALAG